MRVYLIALVFGLLMAFLLVSGAYAGPVEIAEGMAKDQVVVCTDAKTKERYVVDNTAMGIILGHGKHPDCLAIMDTQKKTHVFCGTNGEDTCTNSHKKFRHGRYQ